MGAQTGRHVNVCRYRCACVCTFAQACVLMCASVQVCMHLCRHMCIWTFAQACVWVVCTGVCACVHVCRHVCVCRSVCPFLWVRLTSFTSLVIGRDVSFLLTNIVLCSLVPELREPKTLQWAVLSGTLSLLPTLTLLKVSMSATYFCNHYSMAACIFTLTTFVCVGSKRVHIHMYVENR